jgi:hypothetical protein
MKADENSNFISPSASPIDSTEASEARPKKRKFTRAGSFNDRAEPGN